MDRDEIFDGFEQELVWLIGRAGGINALARELQVSPPAISYWLRRKRLPSPQQVLNIEAYTKGAITRQMLRPDIYPSTVILEKQRDISDFDKKDFEQQGRES
jgi:DNA-binding transcriptional regulator YdaS (Cro superfamily)